MVCLWSRVIQVILRKVAFLFAPLLPEEVVYCYPPRGFEQHDVFRGKVLRLEKALYGLKQAPRRWWSELCKLFLKHGLRRTRIDPCLFTMYSDKHRDGYREKKDEFYPWLMRSALRWAS